MNRHKEIGFGIIGMGYMGTHHLRVLKKMALDGFPCRVVTVCDTNESRLHQVVEKYSIQKATTVAAEMMDNKEIDAIFVATPWSSHGREVSMGIDAAKHVYCEKPLGRDFHEATQLARLVAASGRINQAGLLLRHQPSLWKIRDVVQNNDYGELRHVSLSVHSSFPKEGKLYQTTLKDRLAGRGILWEENIHDLDTLLFLFGNMSVESAELMYSREYPGIEIGSLLMLRTCSGVPAVFSSSWHDIKEYTPERRLELVYEKSVISSEYFVSGDVVVRQPNGKVVRFSEGDLRKEYVRHAGLDPRLGLVKDYPWYATFAIGSFLQSLLSESEATPSFSESLLAHELVESIYRKSEESPSSRH